MTAYLYKNSAARPGQDKFDALLITPLAPSEMKAVLRFESGRLTSMYVDLGDSPTALDRIKEQITSKYGTGRIDDTRKEEQCIYKNGANFKLTSGSIRTSWTEQGPQATRVVTNLSDTSVEICPSDLRSGGIGPIKLKSISISKSTEPTDAPAKNLF